FADAQHALHLAPASGRVAVSWEHDGQEKRGQLELAAGWRKSDISWRKSMLGLEPAPFVNGRDLGEESRKRLRLSAKALAVPQADYVPRPARDAGLRPGDVILGVDGKSLEMTALQFSAYVRTTYRVGDKVTYNILRDGQRVDVSLTLPAGQ